MYFCCCSLRRRSPLRSVENVRIWSENDKTRVVLDLSKSVQHNIFTLRGPDRLVIDLKDSRLAKSLTAMPQGAGAVRSIRSAVRVQWPAACGSGFDIRPCVPALLPQAPTQPTVISLVIDLAKVGSAIDGQARVRGVPARARHRHCHRCRSWRSRSGRDRSEAHP